MSKRFRFPWWPVVHHGHRVHELQYLVCVRVVGMGKKNRMKAKKKAAANARGGGASNSDRNAQGRAGTTAGAKPAQPISGVLVIVAALILGDRLH